MCGQYSKVILQLPVKIWQWMVWFSGGDSAAGGTLAGIPQTGDLVFSAAPQATNPGRLLCDGSEVSKTTYANLYAAIGDVYGNAGSSANFKLPDFRARFPVGVGSFATAGSAAVYGTSGGEDVHVLATGEMPKHSHLVCNTETKANEPGGGTTFDIDANHTLAGNITHSGDGSTLFKAASVDPDVAANVGKSSATGGADTTASPAVGGHNNLPPYLPCYIYIIT